MRKITFYLLMLFSISAIGQGVTHTISDPAAITSLSASLQAGDEVVLLDGTYTSDERIKFSPTTGTAAEPITFRAETPGGVKFTGGLKMSIGGDHVIVDGFYWKGGIGASNFIEFRDGSSNYANHSTIQNCAIDGLEIDPDDAADDIIDKSITKHRWIVLYGTYNTVINCSFMNKNSAGALVLAEMEYNASPDGVSNTRCNVVGHTISNNYFYRYAKMDASLSNSGDSETIRIGTSEYQNVNSETTVSNNYFVEADGENEIITNKSKNNTYINNTFRRCRGSLVLRHGSGALVDGNYFLGENVEGTGGIRIVDSEHTVTNNYIQDCINVLDQAKWNNGITFLGGGDSHAVDCNSTSVSNGYQKTVSVNISNNSLVNTNAPLFYNEDKGSNDPSGSVINNLVYFASGNGNVTDVITGDSATAFDNLGTGLTYNGNVYTGTSLGATNAGFSEDNSITATASGEIFTFSGNKGADMGAYQPATDAMVGQGIGACFLDNSGAVITSGNCTIQVLESLTVGGLSTLDYTSGSYDVDVNANVSWSATVNDNWITLSQSSGTGDATVSVTVTENTLSSSRTGTVTFEQTSGNSSIVRTLTVSQDMADPRANLNLINPTATDVSVYSYTNQEVDPSKNKDNQAVHSLDKISGTYWASDRTQDPAGSGKSIIIYDLQGAFDLDLIDIATSSGKTYNLQIWVSTSGVDDADFTNVFGDIVTTSDGDMQPFIPSSTIAGVKYVKIIGDGQPGGSNYTSIHEIEFYTSQALSNSEFEKNTVKLYPNPVVNGVLYLNKQDSSVSDLRIYDISGKTILIKKLNPAVQKEVIDVSSISKGIYFVEITNGTSRLVNKIVVSK
ncbi:T9SS type A sorting domain-containing protein [Tamlana agarivorans]|uniref:T9SS type A sorting domain-containing protein n=1 Tax=Pseudotamlana agarivorans TaxID=481183 RepID=A0ACC5U6S6_9FLAO|nr:chondroitinase-B domain-containing protein [Tamlana agarivorans]MBU2949943.1 T9SS type A sorting domain-containing protein [Tamlana agarivorans]